MHLNDLPRRFPYRFVDGKSYFQGRAVHSFPGRRIVVCIVFKLSQITVFAVAKKHSLLSRIGDLMRRYADIERIR